MRNVCLVAAALTAGFPMVASATETAYVTERGRLICTTQQSYAEAQRAVEARDKKWLESIRECGQSQAGQRAEVVQHGVLTARIRIYDESGKSTIYWTTPTILKEVRR